MRSIVPYPENSIPPIGGESEVDVRRFWCRILLIGSMIGAFYGHETWGAVGRLSVIASDICLVAALMFMRTRCLTCNVITFLLMLLIHLMAIGHAALAKPTALQTVMAYGCAIILTATVYWMFTRSHANRFRTNPIEINPPRRSS